MSDKKRACFRVSKAAQESKKNIQRTRPNYRKTK